MNLPDVQMNTTDDPKKIAAWAIVLLLAGAGLTGYGVSQYQSHQETLDGVVEVDATVVDSRIESVRDGGVDNDPNSGVGSTDEDDVKFRLIVEYEYEYEGEQYRSSKFNVAGSVERYDTRAQAREALQEYPEGERVTAYVDPAAPDEAFLDDGMPLIVYAVVGFGALLILGSVWLGVNFVRNVR